MTMRNFMFTIFAYVMSVTYFILDIVSIFRHPEGHSFNYAILGLLWLILARIESKQ